MRPFALAFGCAILALFASVPAPASVSRGDSFKAARVSRPPQFDARLSDPEWQQGIVATDFVSMTTRRHEPANATTAYLVYDSDNIYVAFRCEQPGVSITANQTTNNIGLGLDDYVAVGFDPAGNGTREYYFFTTPRGVRFQQSTESVRYNPTWESHAAINGSEWTAELIVPIRIMRTGSGSIQSWRFSFARLIAAHNEQFSWAFDPRMGGAGDSIYWPLLTEIAVTKRSSRPQPYADIYGLTSAGKDRNVFQQANGSFASVTSRNYGVDLTYPLTQSLAFVGTLAPDFSNVETDQQVIAPQEFRRFLAEYRPFFSQGANYLTPGLGDNLNGSLFSTLFYSPSIGIFNRGLKIEGTQALTALGVLEAQGPGFDDVAYGFNHRGPAQDFRYFFDGVFANHSDGKDTVYQFGGRRTNLVSGIEYGAEFAGESGTFVPDAGQAHYFDAYADISKPNYTAFAGYHDLGPYFAPIDGFTPLNDARGPWGFFNLNGSGSGHSVIKTMNWFMGGERYLERSGNVHSQDIQYNGEVVFKDLIGISAGDALATLRTYPGDPLNGFPTYAGGIARPFNQANVDLSYGDGTSTPVDLGWAWGNFATFCPSGPPAPQFCGAVTSDFVNSYVQQFTASTSRPLGTRYSIALEYDGTRERPLIGGPPDSQFLRRIVFGRSLGADSNISIAYRSISGTGGFAAPGNNLAIAYHRKLGNGSELFVAFGTPAANATLDRLIVKYVWHVGGPAGT